MKYFEIEKMHDQNMEFVSRFDTFQEACMALNEIARDFHTSVVSVGVESEDQIIADTYMRNMSVFVFPQTGGLDQYFIAEGDDEMDLEMGW